MFQLTELLQWAFLPVNNKKKKLRDMLTFMHVVHIKIIYYTLKYLKTCKKIKKEHLFYVYQVPKRWKFKSIFNLLLP